LKDELDALKAWENAGENFFFKGGLEMPPAADRTGLCSSTVYDLGDSTGGSPVQLSEFKSY
jgi:hypothetical protein